MELNTSQAFPVLGLGQNDLYGYGPLVSRLSEHITPVNAVWALIGLVTAFRVYKAQKPKGSVEVISEGHTNPIGSFFSADQYMKDAKNWLTRGYYKYGKATFRVPEMEQWTIIINKPELIEEIRMAPDNRFSFIESVEAFMTAKHTFGQTLLGENSYHNEIVRNQLTRSMTTTFEDICDEIARAMNDVIPQSKEDSEWVGVNCLASMRDVVCRASNRVFVGAPLCRDKGWMELNVQYTIDVANRAQFLRRFPMFLRPIVATYLTRKDDSLKRSIQMSGPIIRERMRMFDETGGDWPDKPLDLVSWLLESAGPAFRSVQEVARRLLMVNFAAIHTSSNTFAHALLHLAAEPQYVEPLREEVEQIIKEDGWTKVAMTKMRKLDSFLKESQRVNGIGLTSLQRKAMVDTVLSDGTFIPKGSFLAANMSTIHHDPELYPEPNEFKPWRFFEMREKSAEEAVKHQAVNTSVDYLTFGHGRHACPGRFFAINELKAMMCYLVMNYDIRAEKAGVRPPNFESGVSVIPNPFANVLFRKRSEKA